MGLLKKELPQDDVKYIFTVENELESASNIARKKLQRLAKKKRYNKNKQENKLVNALESALNLSLGDENSNNGEEVSFLKSQSLHFLEMVNFDSNLFLFRIQF